MRNFDNQVDRSHTESTKWERYQNELPDQDFLPMWLADMDLPCSEEIQEALLKRAMHPIYGYTDRDIRYNRIFAERFKSHHGYQVDENDVVLSTGVMYSICCGIRLFSKPLDRVVVLSPSYHPFITAIENSDRLVLRSEMVVCNHHYEINFEDLEEKLKQASIFLLCNPHNPTGRVFTETELKKIAVLCEKYQVVIIADEIHCDFTYDNHAFIPIMMISEYTKEHTISCVAPTKSFNLAGLKISAAIIKNKEWKARFQKEASTIGISSINIFAMEAMKAAYLQSDEWQKELFHYLNENRKFIASYLDTNLPEIGYEMPEGTYFYWLDFSAYQHGDQFQTLFKEQGNIVLSSGCEFSDQQATWLRMNFACPRKMIACALDRIHILLRNEVMK